jgi:hypothetical protein
VGIVAMKVFGGLGTGMSGYGGPPAPPLVGEENTEAAIRYALGLPGVASVNIGVHSPDQVRKNAEMVARFRPLGMLEGAALAHKGRQMAAEWGEHFGPVEEPEAVG